MSRASAIYRNFSYRCRTHPQALGGRDKAQVSWRRGEEGEKGGTGSVLHTFFGGTIATADLGAIMTCGLLSFSPLMDLLKACKTRISVSCRSKFEKINK